MYARYAHHSNFPINVILMQPTTSHESFSPGSDFVNFETESKTRQFPIIVRDKKFYVDSHVFAKNSDYFKAMMRSKSFREGELGVIEINDESPQDILSLIRVLSPNYLGLYPDKIDEENVCTILRLCDKYLITNLKENCIDFLEQYDPSSRPLQSVLIFFYRLCFTLRIEYEHDLCLAEIAHDTMYSCLTQLIKPPSSREFLELRLNLMKCEKQKNNDGLQRVVEAMTRGNMLFEHRLSYNEEVQGLGCQQCLMRPPARQTRFNNGKSFLCLCNSCGKEVCVQCRRKPCIRLFDEWIAEVRS